MVKRALIVVDMQNDFLTGTLSLKDCPAKQDGVKVVSIINDIIKKNNWDLVVYTFDWHPNNHISFVTNAQKYVQHEKSEVSTTKAEIYDKITFDIDGLPQEQIMWPPHCIQNSWGAKLHSDLYVSPDGINIYKGDNNIIDSYSAFFDNGKVKETKLREVLLEHKIDSTYICGVATDVCVNFTALDSHEIGFETHVFIDACAGVSLTGIKETLETFKNRGIKVITNDCVSNNI